jgi:hypothetical protein
MRLKFATVFVQPKISSTFLRTRWLMVYPGCRVVRASIADPRCSLMFWATWGVTFMFRQALTNSTVFEVLVGTDGDVTDSVDRIGQHLEPDRTFRCSVGLTDPQVYRNPSTKSVRRTS